MRTPGNIAAAKLLGALALSALWLIQITNFVYADQNRDQCDRCCKKTIQDEYYQEQCVLKCFRNHDHCRESAAAPAEPTAEQAKTAPAEQPAPPPRNRQPGYAGPSAPGVQPGPAVQEPAAPRPPQRGPAFQFPNPLNLSPGKEWEAAGQILMANGFTQQHPNYQPALKAIEGVLINFGRANPSGGRLPKSQLEQIIRHYR